MDREPCTSAEPGCRCIWIESSFERHCSHCRRGRSCPSKYLKFLQSLPERWNRRRCWLRPSKCRDMCACKQSAPVRRYRRMQRRRWYRWFRTRARRRRERNRSRRRPCRSWHFHPWGFPRRQDPKILRNRGLHRCPRWTNSSRRPRSRSLCHRHRCRPRRCGDHPSKRWRSQQRKVQNDD